MARGLTSTERAALLSQVREIYARLAQRPIERNCLNRTECCRFRLTGRTPQNKILVFAGPHDRLRGEIIPVKVLETKGYTLYGELA